MSLQMFFTFQKSHFPKMFVIGKMSKLKCLLCCMLISMFGTSVVCRITQYCSCYLLFSIHWNQDTREKNSQFWQLPNHWQFWEMALWKGEGHSIYILKSPSLEDLSQRSTNVIFLQNPGIGPCRAIPLEQLTKIARKSTYNRIKLKVAGAVPRGWSSDYVPPHT